MSTDVADVVRLHADVDEGGAGLHQAVEGLHHARVAELVVREVEPTIKFMIVTMPKFYFKLFELCRRARTSGGFYQFGTL